MYGFSQASCLNLVIQNTFFNANPLHSAFLSFAYVLPILFYHASSLQVSNFYSFM